MATRKQHERPLTETERRLSYAKDCDWQAAWEDAYALRCAARGDFERAQAASARAARWRVNAQAWRGTGKVAGDRQLQLLPD